MCARLWDGIHATQIADQQFDNIIKMAGLSIPWDNGADLEIIITLLGDQVYTSNPTAKCS